MVVKMRLLLILFLFFKVFFMLFYSFGCGLDKGGEIIIK